MTAAVARVMVVAAVAAVAAAMAVVTAAAETVKDLQGGARSR